MMAISSEGITTIPTQITNSSSCPNLSNLQNLDHILIPPHRPSTPPLPPTTLPLTTTTKEEVVNMVPHILNNIIHLMDLLLAIIFFCQPPLRMNMMCWMEMEEEGMSIQMKISFTTHNNNNNNNKKNWGLVQEEE